MVESVIEQNPVDELATATALTAEEESVIKAMMSAGVFYGLSKSKTNPKIRRYLSGTKSGMEIINLTATLKSLTSACQAIKDKVKEGGLILVVGTTPAVKAQVKELGMKLNLPYVTERWLGGTLTNFKTILSRLQYLKKLQTDKESGQLEKYTKKERLKIEREIAKLEKLFSGLERMDKLPGMVIIFDLKNHELVAQEAKRMKIPSVALADTNADPESVDYPIVGNSRNPKSVEFIAAYLGRAIEAGKKEALELGQIKEAKQGS